MAMINCPECGKEISDKAQTCIGCGCPIIPKIICTECGAENNGNAAVCFNCGAPITPVQSQSQQQSQYNQQQYNQDYQQYQQPQYQQPQQQYQQQPYQQPQQQYQQPPYQQPMYQAPPPVHVTVTNVNTNTNTNQNMGGYPGRPKDKWVALLLCFFLGLVGAHKFYEGKIIRGIIYICTAGLFGIGVLIDFIAILLKPNPYYV